MEHVCLIFDSLAVGCRLLAMTKVIIAFVVMMMMMTMTMKTLVSRIVRRTHRSRMQSLGD